MRIKWAGKTFGRWVQTQVDGINSAEEGAFGGVFHADELSIVGRQTGMYGLVLVIVPEDGCYQGVLSSRGGP